MKTRRLQLFLTGAFFLASASLFSQIVIEQSDFPVETTSHRESFYFGTNLSSYETPTEGANQVWDYQGILKGALASFDHFTTTDPFFSESIHYEQTSVGLSLFSIPTDLHYGFDNAAYYAYGKEQYDTTFSISAATGGPNDVIQFIDDKQYLAADDEIVVFPLTYGDSWSVETSRTTPFLATIAAFGLNGVPGYHKRLINNDREVVGYGHLLMTYGANETSDSMEVLLVKTITEEIDSFYLSGGLAPAPILAGLGITQGAVQNSVSYDFYRKGFGDVILKLDASDGTPGSFLNAMRFNSAAIVAAPPVDTTDTTTGPGGIFTMNSNHLDVEITNPVKIGGNMMINMGSNGSGLSQVGLVNLNGQEVSRQAIFRDVETHEVSVASDLSEGTYIVIGYGESGETIFSKPIVVVQ